ncbi:MAG: peptide/nickel transport system substrate-binding protein [Planctomycetota bacterium]|jgi:peptide/nickel transport system substrate-binding protein
METTMSAMLGLGTAAAGRLMVRAPWLALFLGFGSAQVSGLPLAQGEKREAGAVATSADIPGGPGQVRADVFHPSKSAVEPRRGGRVVVHLATMPRHLNHMTENSAVSRWIYNEVHESLLQRDWETWEWESHLSDSVDVEDLLILQSGERLFGEVSQVEDRWRIQPASASNPLREARSYAAAEVDSVLRGTVYTFNLRDDVLWHDGHPFSAADVEFSWRMYFNPTVDCESARDKQQMARSCEVIDEHTVRFVCDRQYFNLQQNFYDLCLTPRHLYDLSDPDNADFRGDVDPLGPEQGSYLNNHPNNRMWVGLGPYRITQVDDQFVDAVRFEDYFDGDPKAGRAGWVDAIRWRHIPVDDAAKTALVNDELDYMARLSPEDFFGPFTRQATFVEDFYKGYVYLPRMQYIAWNMRRPIFRDADVRRALGHAFDWEEFIVTQGHGLGARVTSSQYLLHANYDRELAPLPFDLDLAEEILDDAGWYDRDGDGIRDKDGLALSFDFLLQPGNSTTQAIVRTLQENLARIGVELKTVTKDYAAVIASVRAKEFDAFSLSWVLDVENDPEQLWQSWGGDPSRDPSANYPGWGTAASDALIKRIQGEVDPAARALLHHELQRMIYEDQPYMFAIIPPVRFAVSQSVRNLKVYGLNPGYSIRDWFLLDEESEGR